MDLQAYWDAVLGQRPQKLRAFFHPEAHVDWPNTNERFTLGEFIRANCEYPGRWDGELERVERLGDLLITVVHVHSLEQPLSFHVASFIQLKDDLIFSIDEYWSDDGPAPQWRRDKHIGVPICPQTH